MNQEKTEFDLDQIPVIADPIDVRSSYGDDFTGLLDFVLKDKGNRADRRWATIVDAAVQCFYEAGYPATTIRQIAASAGLTSGSLYYYVDSKDDLLFAIIVGVHIEGRRREQEPLISGSSPREVLAEIVRRHIDSTLHQLKETAITNENWRYLSADRRALLRRSRRHRENWIAGLIEYGQRVGDFKPEGDPLLLSTGLLSALNSIAVWYRPGGRWEGDDLKEAYVHLLLRGL